MTGSSSPSVQLKIHCNVLVPDMELSDLPLGPLAEKLPWSKVSFTLWSSHISQIDVESVTSAALSTSLLQALVARKLAEEGNNNKDTIKNNSISQTDFPNLCYLHRLFIFFVQPRNLKEDVWFEKESLPCLKITLDFNDDGVFWKNKQKRIKQLSKNEPKKSTLNRKDPCRFSYQSGILSWARFHLQQRSSHVIDTRQGNTLIYSAWHFS